MIGGNTTGILQVQAGHERDSVGKRIPKWHDVPIKDEKPEILGWLDLQAGDSKRTTFNAKIQESTHVFVCDYQPIPATLEIEGEVVKVEAETVRFVANSRQYDVMLIDDPMELHQQLEIYLKYTGGQ
ncbi:MAG: hypothetical protein IJZ23_06895 [Roseburia sp.]|nr:hypothetical protein [Roseburia sp.]MBQ8279552.1 hypothetical protein [Roseburia sp.]